MGWSSYNICQFLWAGTKVHVQIINAKMQYKDGAINLVIRTMSS